MGYDCFIITWFSWAVDWLEAFAPDCSTRRCEEDDTFVLSAPLGLHHVDGDFVLAGEHQSREVDVIVLHQNKHCFQAWTALTFLMSHVPRETSKNQIKNMNVVELVSMPHFGLH